MTTEEIINDLKSRGEKHIEFKEDGNLIVSRHGKNTINYWRIIKDKLICVDCKTVY